MTNELAVIAPGIDAFKDYAAQRSVSMIAGDLLLFKKGDWFRGADQVLVKDGTTFVANMAELWEGWVKWQDHRPVDYQMARVIERRPPLARSALGDDNPADWELDDNGKPRDPWQRSVRMIMRDIKGEELLTFASNSRGGQSCVDELVNQHIKHGATRPGKFPIVKVGTETYNHKKYGPTKTPIMTIVGYTTWETGGAIDRLEAKKDAKADTKAKVAATLDDEIPF